MKSGPRSYQQSARAASSAETRERILDATEALVWARDPDEITLDDVASKAGVTLQTVLRKFGSKDALFAVTLEERAGRVIEQRRPAARDARSAVTALVASYEAIGDANWRMLRHEHLQPALRMILDRARALHRSWVEDAFAQDLPARGVARARRVDAIATVLDFYVWKLHRVDLGKSRPDVEALMLSLVQAVLA